MQSTNLGLAPAFSFFPNLNPPHKTFTFHQILVLIVTFIAYASFHASRKPLSIVKSVLGPSIDSKLDPDSNLIDNGWAPFNGTEGTRRLGELDLAFLSSYALGMYFSGQLGDRVDLRLFLVFGMTGSGILTIVFALGFWMNIHLLGFYMSVQIVCGLFQSIGWPSVVAVVGNWFCKEKRGLIMGLWNSHTSLGNIVGSLLASSLLEFGWGWSFALPGFLVIVSGLLVFLFLVVRPQDLGYEEVEKEMEMSSVEENLRKLEAEDVGLLETPKELNESMVASEDVRLLETPKELNESMVAIEDVRLLETPKELNESMVAIEDVGLLETPKELNESMVAIGFIEAWRLPGVTSFAFCLFFSKLVAYTFLYWLPYYLRHTGVAGVHLSHKTAGILSTVFDIGGVFGGVSAGYISDKIKARALTSITFLTLSIPVLVMYRTYGSVSMFINIVLMFLSGLLVNGPYALITTAVAADLGTQDSIRGNSRALATVTAIIDGTGSVGAALGPLLAGYISTRGWNSVFLMLIVSIFFAILFLVRLAKAEIKEMRSSGELISTSDPQNR